MGTCFSLQQIPSLPTAQEARKGEGCGGGGGGWKKWRVGGGSNKGQPNKTTTCLTRPLFLGPITGRLSQV